MKQSAKILLVVGAIMMVIGLIVGSTIEDEAIGLIEENRLYDGKDSEMELEGIEGNSKNFVVIMEGSYTSGNSSLGEDLKVYLTQADCDLVKEFTLNDSQGQNVFEPFCEITDDQVEDGWIHIGYICNDGDGCPDGTYTWDTQGTEIQVYDIEGVIETIFEVVKRALASFGACCCGVVILIVGIIVAVTSKDDERYQKHYPPGGYSGQSQGHYPPPPDGPPPYEPNPYEQRPYDDPDYGKTQYDERGRDK